MGSKFSYALIAAATAGLIATGAVAKDRKLDGGTPKIFTDVTDCRTIADSAQRLACYDRTVGALAAAQASENLYVADKETMRETRRGLFGFNLGNIFGGGDNDDKDRAGPELAEMETLTSTITEVRQIGRKTYVLRIAEANALWEINEAPSRFIMPKVGETVEFKKAAMGSYFIRVGKQIGVKGKRIG